MKRVEIEYGEVSSEDNEFRALEAIAAGINEIMDFLEQSENKQKPK